MCYQSRYLCVPRLVDHEARPSFVPAGSNSTILLDVISKPFQKAVTQLPNPQTNTAEPRTREHSSYLLEISLPSFLDEADGILDINLFLVTIATML